MRMAIDGVRSNFAEWGRWVYLDNSCDQRWLTEFRAAEDERDQEREKMRERELQERTAKSVIYIEERKAQKRALEQSNNDDGPKGAA